MGTNVAKFLAKFSNLIIKYEFSTGDKVSKISNFCDQGKLLHNRSPISEFETFSFDENRFV